eukprot:6197863-Pleurochrysis_carterae.AAC.1
MCKANEHDASGVFGEVSCSDGNKRDTDAIKGRQLDAELNAIDRSSSSVSDRSNAMAEQDRHKCINICTRRYGAQRS